MTTPSYNYLKAQLFIVILILITGCSFLSPENKSTFSVSWTGYTMGELLSDPFIIKDRKDIQRAINAPWYAEITILENSKEILLGNCKNYLSVAIDTLQTLRGNEIYPFRELAMMCRTSELLLNATPPVKSNINSNFINKHLPKKLPKEIAFQTSTVETEESMLDSTKKYWGDVNQNLKFQALSKGKAKYFDAAGSQTISIIARGDFNGDGLEDILLTSQDEVNGGSYSNLRLFALTFDKQKEWQLIQEYRY